MTELVEILRAHALLGGPRARTDEVGAKIADCDLLTAAADEIEAQQAALDRVLALHLKMHADEETQYWCSVCLERWPCETVRILEPFTNRLQSES